MIIDNDLLRNNSPVKTFTLLHPKSDFYTGVEGVYVATGISMHFHVELYENNLLCPQAPFLGFIKFG